MPIETTATLIKTSGDRNALAPRLAQFYLFCSTTESKEFIRHIEAVFPGSVSVTDENHDILENGAMLNSEQALQLEEILKTTGLRRFGSGESSFSYSPAMRELLQSGYSMIVTHG